MEDRILGLSSVTQKYQVTLTKDVRDVLGVKPGDKVVFVQKGDAVIVKKA
ncbi:looped-hinge helix DNA binding protein domain protein, AbrB family [Archaeoglobus fulgidus DSM 8774]|uniref:Looped-hinge helix DNA binding protein domain protein, AbrB family n=1 Tax=Archaeoglobus fulgidus DSM 8774 TaxID=1344584 RepID=A0A075WBQ0_ARCFL|nr:AbrB/MazE/SpoVT family DNA-binding domain-containing protein [Archaeoglobus fulgidus]AIG97391.1 looped-hinge helix DNA binding protein domain protein, AbrB family [Archaeoglobus fulgidus DSM 8774]